MPVELGLFRTSQNAVVAAGTDVWLSAILSSSDLQRSITQKEDFMSSFDSLPGLNTLLHGPVLGKGTTDEVPIVKPLRDLGSTSHLRAAVSSIVGFLNHLASLSAAGIAVPAASELVWPELLQIFVSLASSLDESAGFKARPAGPQPGPTAASPQLQLSTILNLRLCAWTCPGRRHRRGACSSSKSMQQLVPCKGVLSSWIVTTVCDAKAIRTHYGVCSVCVLAC